MPTQVQCETRTDLSADEYLSCIQYINADVMDVVIPVLGISVVLSVSWVGAVMVSRLVKRFGSAI